jgi:toxin YoeB
MKLIWSEKSWEDYLYWQSHDKKLLKKINTLIKDIKREPFDGLGKPEPLRYELAGCWSRRITDEHRLVYEIAENDLHIVSCRFHYD